MAASKDEFVVDPVIKADRLEYLPPPEPFYVQQGLKEKLIAKTKENPFVPIGVIFTSVVLCIGLSTLKTGDNRKAQLMMRLRVGGQAFAILALLGGVYLKSKAERGL
ncbi:HIG1 domain family member 2A-like [Physella acuta]|uniref:HIG1 domain family member 2A-like n=1 Tax=Physella acuta TaxID=109671 RepID=UPI0027DB9131|nr:HIG1 domain family member 2A-like [Physella acuta]